jgi:NADH-quinone oxidoreductase subunit E
MNQSSVVPSVEGQQRSEDLIAVLQAIQSECHYLPQGTLVAVAKHFGVPLSEVFHIATFYNCFSLEPRGKHVVQVCLGTACHVRGGQQVLDKILRDLKMAAPGTSSDMEFSVEPVRCLGCCGLAPVMRVDKRTHGHLKQAVIPRILKSYRAKPEKPIAAAAASAGSNGSQD